MLQLFKKGRHPAEEIKFICLKSCLCDPIVEFAARFDWPKFPFCYLLNSLNKLSDFLTLVPVRNLLFKDFKPLLLLMPQPLLFFSPSASFFPLTLFSFSFQLASPAIHRGIYKTGNEKIQKILKPLCVGIWPRMSNACPLSIFDG